MRRLSPVFPQPPPPPSHRPTMSPAKGRALAAAGPLLLHRVAVSARAEGARLGAVVGMGRGGAAT